jgi:hypothetical protein
VYLPPLAPDDNDDVAAAVLTVQPVLNATSSSKTHPATGVSVGQSVGTAADVLS